MHLLDRIFRIVLPVGAMAVLGTVLTVGWFTQPDRYAKGFAPEQPIPFSHALHAGQMRMSCTYCHTGATQSRAAGVPPVETCMNCHTVTKKDSPAIQKLTRIYQNNEPLPWKRIHALPDHVFFDHRPHVNRGIACQSCHGEVQTMTRVSQQMGLRMANCLSCHRDAHEALPKGSPIKKGPEHCGACHR